MESMSVASGCGLYIGFLILLIPIYIMYCVNGNPAHPYL